MMNTATDWHAKIAKRLFTLLPDNIDAAVIVLDLMAGQLEQYVSADTLPDDLPRRCMN
jgi:hypothetical protein